MPRPRKHPRPGKGICPGCGVEFQKSYLKQKYHDQRCFITHYNKKNEDGHSNRGAAIAGRVRAAQVQGNGTADWYLKEGGRHVHRTVAERVLGRSLTSTEVVHHDDLNKKNNEPWNLIIFPSQAWHARHHKLGHPGQAKCDCQGIRLKEVMPNEAP